jgi:uncharacterized protein YjbI with pentapeptide repeats
MEFTHVELYQILNQPGPLNFRGCDLSGADLKDADLRDCNLKDANLTGALLQGADLTGALMQGCQLNGADLTGANINRTVLRGARYRGATKWPAGFDPEKAGAVTDVWTMTRVDPVERAKKAKKLAAIKAVIDANNPLSIAAARREAAEEKKAAEDALKPWSPYK